MTTVGYATLQIIPSVRGIANEIRQQLAPAAGEGERAGEESGRSFGEGFQHLLEAAGIMTAVEKITEGVSEAFGEAIEQSGMPGHLQAQLGVTAQVAQRYGDIAGKLYAGAVTESVEAGAETIRAVVGAGLVPAGATNAQLQSIATKVADVSNAFGQDLGPTAVAAGQIVRNGMAKNVTQALDLITAGLRGTDERGEDLLETFGEYSPVFKTLGLDGATSLGLIRQGLAGGAKDTDVIGDAIKEFSLRVTGGGASIDAAFKAAGLSSKQLTKAVASGGPPATKALGTVLDALRQMPPTAARAQVIQNLFGGPGEDLGAAIFSLNVRTAAGSLGTLSGAADNTGKSLRDNAGARLTQFSRDLRQGLVQVIGGQVLPRLLALGTTVQTKLGPPLTRVGGILARDVGPAMDATGQFIAGTLVPALISTAQWTQRNAGTLEIVGGVVGTLLLPLLLTLGVQYTVAGAAAVVSGAQQVGAWVASGASAVQSAALQVVASYRTVGGWIASGAAALAAGARVVATWVLTGAAAAAGAVVQTISAAEVVAGWVLMGVQSLLQAARMAAAWLIALGPIGWITIAVVAIVALVIANWSKISSWTVSIWHAIVGWITTAGTTVLNWLKANWPLILAILTGPIGIAVLLITKYWSKISAGFSSAYHATVGVGAALIGWVNALPGRVGRALLTLGVKVYSAVSGGFSRAKSAAAAEGAKLLTYAAGLPGQIKTKLGKLGTLLYSAGQDLVRGLLHGMSSMVGSLAKQAAGMGKTALKSVKGALGIHSPSVAMAELGRYAGQGLIKGLTGTTAQVAAAAKKVAGLVASAAAARVHGVTRDLSRTVAADNARLGALAKQRDKVASQLKAAQSKLADVQKSWADARDQISSGILQAANITSGVQDGTATTADTVLSRLRGEVVNAQAFAKQLAALQRKGLRSDLIAQIAQAGVDTGGATAAALAAATPAQIAAINAQQAALARAATQAGTAAADAMYGNGIRAAQGLVDGLKKQQGAIERQMITIARAMQTAIRKALGIHSPSRVMAEVGELTGAGVVVGVDAQRGAVEDAMRRLIVPPAPTAPALAAAGVGAASGGGRGLVRTPVRLVIDGHEFNAYLEERIDEGVDAGLTAVRRSVGARGSRR